MCTAVSSYNMPCLGFPYCKWGSVPLRTHRIAVRIETVPSAWHDASTQRRYVVAPRVSLLITVTCRSLTGTTAPLASPVAMTALGGRLSNATPRREHGERLGDSRGRGVRNGRGP